jgi:hypothetical protein
VQPLVAGRWRSNDGGQLWLVLQGHGGITTLCPHLRLKRGNADPYLDSIRF